MPRKRRKRLYGTGTIFERGGRFVVQVRRNGRRLTKTVSTREIAETVLARWRELEEKAPTPEVPTLAELAAAWLERRKLTHRSHDHDRLRWKNHLAPRIGHLRPHEVTKATVREIVETLLAAKLSPASAQRVVRLLSTFYADLVERDIVGVNPAKGLPRSTRRLIRPAWDPRRTPFLERLEDVRRVFLALPHPVNVAFATGALAGLRTGEVRALRWENVDLDASRLHVRESVEGATKDDDSRVVPIGVDLAQVLAEQRLLTGGTGLVVPPMRGELGHLDEHTMGTKLRDALEKLKLPRMTWYSATRHTFASHWVLAGGTIEKLREILGHSTVLVTERYAHLRADLFSREDLARVRVDLSSPAGKVLPMARSEKIGSNLAAEDDDNERGEAVSS